MCTRIRHSVIFTDTDLTLTSERVVELFSSLKDNVVDAMGEAYLDIPPSKQDEFKINYQSPARRKEAYLDYYIHNHPTASWTTIVNALCASGLHQQADVVENTYVQGTYDITNAPIINDHFHRASSLYNLR